MRVCGLSHVMTIIIQSPCNTAVHPQGCFQVQRVRKELLCVITAQPTRVCTPFFPPSTLCAEFCSAPRPRHLKAKRSRSLHTMAHSWWGGLWRRLVAYGWLVLSLCVVCAAMAMQGARSLPWNGIKGAARHLCSPHVCCAAGGNRRGTRCRL